MKIILTILITTATCAIAFGQSNDTTFVSIGQDTTRFEKQRFIDRYDYVFGVNQPTRFLLKWNVFAALLPANSEGKESFVTTGYDEVAADISRTELSAELKLTRQFSLQVTGSVGFLEGDFYKGKQKRIEWRMEPRFYFDMPKRIKSGKSADNLSGNYIGIEYGRSRQTARKGTEPGLAFTSNTYSLRMGLQRRLFRYGYADISGGIGYRDVAYDASGLQYRSHPMFFNTRVAIGLAIGAPKYKQMNETPYCEVLRCFQEDRRMFKIDLLRAIQLRSDLLRFNPSFAYEQKLGESAFSVELESVFSTNARSVNFTSHQEAQWKWEYSVAFSAEPRWYFLQKRRVALGKSGNNLSGVYGALNARYYWRYSDFIKNFYGGNAWVHGPQLSPIVGFQYRLFRNGFVNYKFGVAWDKVRFDRLKFSDPSHLFSELKIGLAF